MQQSTIDFTAHNIRLDDGRQTNPALGATMDQHPWFVSARRILKIVFPHDKSNIRVADLGCLEGGFSVEFARLGFQVLAIEVRESNIAACRFVKEHTNLPNLEFVRDDAWNVAKYGVFDCIFCCGLLYHLDRPKQFLQLLGSVTRHLVILQTHFASDQANAKHKLSAIAENEGLLGRWHTEFGDLESYTNRETFKWSSWDNRRSFWLKREFLIQAIQNAGFDFVAEQFDGLGTDIVGSMTTGYYRTEDRSTFLGIKT